jgi:hypothetical protein
MQQEEALHTIGLELSMKDDTSSMVNVVLEYRKSIRQRLGLDPEISYYPKSGQTQISEGKLNRSERKSRVMGAIKSRAR